MVSSTSEEEAASVSKTNLDDSDLTNQLPDHILIRILSLLTNIKEAGKTCLISRRWRHLWKFTTRLNFDRPEALQSEYTTMVNRVLSLHELPSLDSLTTEFELKEGFSRDIDEFIKNLMKQKRVKTLELQLRGYSNFEDLLKECHSCFKSLSNLSNTKCLVSLDLNNVNVDGQFLENCPNLHKLIVSGSEELVELKVSGPPWLNLKHLEISSCQQMESIELSAPTLETFHYFGRRIEFIVGDNPNLSELDFRGGYEEHMISYALGPFSSHLSQLKMLRMKTDLKKRAKEIPKLRNLNHLILDFRLGKYSNGLIDLMSRILLAAPSLNKIVFNLSSQHVTTRRHNGTPDATLFQYHLCLKEVEIFGFVGGDPEFELAKYLLKVSVNLEKMVVDPFGRNGMNQGKICESKNMEPKFYWLKKLLPRGAELVLL